jgi:hypothetical protein
MAGQRRHPKSNPRAVSADRTPQQLSSAKTATTPVGDAAVSPDSKRKLAQGFRRSWNWTWRLVTAGVTVYTLLTTYVALRYGISVSAFATINAANPFKTVFMLSNESPFPIRDVSYTCAYTGVYTEDGIEQSQKPSGRGPVKLPDHGKIVLFCPRSSEIHGDVIDAGAYLEVDVTYRHTPFPLWWPFQQSSVQKFLLLKTETDHTYVWAPEKPDAVAFRAPDWIRKNSP